MGTLSALYVPQIEKDLLPNVPYYSPNQLKRTFMSAKLTLNTRDELLLIDLDRVAYMQADGNYTQIHYMADDRMVVSIGMSRMEALVESAMHANGGNTFVRISRSLLINQRYLHHVSLTHQRLVLSDGFGHRHELAVSKGLLKDYKDTFTKQLKSR